MSDAFVCVYVAVLEYQTMFQRMMPILARAYAMDASRHYLLKKWAERNDESMTEDGDVLCLCACRCVADVAGARTVGHARLLGLHASRSACCAKRARATATAHTTAWLWRNDHDVFMTLRGTALVAACVIMAVTDVSPQR